MPGSAVGGRRYWYNATGPGVAQGIQWEWNDIALCGEGEPLAGCESVGEGLSQHWNQTCHVPDVHANLSRLAT